MAEKDPLFIFLEIRFLQCGSFDQLNANAIPGPATFHVKRNHRLIKQPDLLCTAGLSYSYSIATIMAGRTCVS